MGIRNFAKASRAGIGLDEKVPSPQVGWGRSVTAINLEPMVAGGGVYFLAETGSTLPTSCSVFCNLSLLSPLQEAF
jgi:hypothetical protein